MRKPVYHEKNKDYQIASVANDKWQFQQMKRFRKRGDELISGGTRERDCWVGLAAPTTYETAMGQMQSRTPS